MAKLGQSTYFFSWYYELLIIIDIVTLSVTIYYTVVVSYTLLKATLPKNLS